MRNVIRVCFNTSNATDIQAADNQWHTQEFCLGGGSANSVEDRENGDLGAVAS